MQGSWVVLLQETVKATSVLEGDFWLRLSIKYRVAGEWSTLKGYNRRRKGKRGLPLDVCHKTGSRLLGLSGAKNGLAGEAEPLGLISNFSRGILNFPHRLMNYYHISRDHSRLLMCCFKHPKDLLLFCWRGKSGGVAEGRLWCKVLLYWFRGVRDL